MLDVGCGVGGPAREIVKFTGANVVGLNNNDYQIERAAHYAQKEGLADKLSFVKGDFMVNKPPFSANNNTDGTSKCPSLRIRSTLSTPSKQPSMHLPSKVSTAKYSASSSQVVFSVSTSGS